MESGEAKLHDSLCGLHEEEHLELGFVFNRLESNFGVGLVWAVRRLWLSSLDPILKFTPSPDSFLDPKGTRVLLTKGFVVEIDVSID